jgi:hypothetical protein
MTHDYNKVYEYGKKILWIMLQINIMSKYYLKAKSLDISEIIKCFNKEMSIGIWMVFPYNNLQNIDNLA